MRISDWSSDVCSSDLQEVVDGGERGDVGVGEGDRVIGHVGEAHGSPQLAGQLLVGTRALPGVGRAQRRRPAEQHHGLRQSADLSRALDLGGRSEEHTSELQSLMRISYAVLCSKKKNNTPNTN